MRFSSWIHWFRSKSILFKWFIIITLIWPIVGEMTNIGIGPFSIHELFGIGIIFFIAISFIFMPSKAIKIKSIPDTLLKAFIFLLFINVFFLILLRPSLKNIDIGMQILLPFLLYLYLKRVYITETDFYGFVQTVYYSAWIVFIIFLFKILSGTADTSLYEKEMNATTLRMEAFTYAIGLFIGIAATTYFYLSNTERKKNPYLKILFLILLLGIIILLRIDHTLSNIVFAILVFISLRDIVKFSRSKLSRIGILFAAILFIVIASNPIIEFYQNTLETELMILRGEEDVGKAFHGRVNRWQYYFSLWSSFNFFNMIIGVPLSTFEGAGSMLGGGMHSDYVRILFGTGMVGLFVFIAFLVSAYRYKIIQGGVGVTRLLKQITIVYVLFAVTSLPLNYHGIYILFMTTLVYAQKVNAMQKLKIRVYPDLAKDISS